MLRANPKCRLLALAIAIVASASGLSTLAQIRQDITLIAADSDQVARQKLLNGQAKEAIHKNLTNDGYTLIWADEFDQDGSPSDENWSFERGFRRNREEQWYQPENAFCENGTLVIEARRERYDFRASTENTKIPAWAHRRPHAEYTSASLNTRGKHDWLYGRFMMRAKIPTLEGTWPAFWTLGHGRWPSCGEIDVMEFYDNSVLANAAWKGTKWRIHWDAKKLPMTHFGNHAWGKDFHVWRMDWNQETIELFVDDELLNTIDLAQVSADNPKVQNPFKAPHYLLVNLAIGGEHGGDPSSTEFPVRYLIDYVRVYQKAAPSGTNTND